MRQTAHILSLLGRSLVCLEAGKQTVAGSSSNVSEADCCHFHPSSDANTIHHNRDPYLFKTHP